MRWRPTGRTFGRAPLPLLLSAGQRLEAPLGQQQQQLQQRASRSDGAWCEQAHWVAARGPSVGQQRQEAAGAALAKWWTCWMAAPCQAACLPGGSLAQQQEQRQQQMSSGLGRRLQQQ